MVTAGCRHTREDAFTTVCRLFSVKDWPISSVVGGKQSWGKLERCEYVFWTQSASSPNLFHWYWAQLESRAGPSCYHTWPQSCTPSSTASLYRWTGAWVNVFYCILTFHADLSVSYFNFLFAETFFWVSVLTVFHNGDLVQWHLL